MTQEEKELLLKDLCARLPYRIKADGYPWITSEYVEAITKESVNIQGSWINIENVKPYLRPMSSMTKEEDKEWQYYKNAIAESCDERLKERISELHDWFAAHHFDFRDLIKKGLALEAKEGLYKIN